MPTDGTCVRTLAPGLTHIALCTVDFAMVISFFKIDKLFMYASTNPFASFFFFFFFFLVVVLFSVYILRPPFMDIQFLFCLDPTTELGISKIKLHIEYPQIKLSIQNSHKGYSLLEIL